MSTFKVIIAGTRTFKDYKLLVETCDRLLVKKHPNIEIVNGGANGADRLGGKYAIQKGYKMTQFKADWDNLGKGAGYARNKEMAEYADAAIIFWDGCSRGAKHMVELARNHCLKLKVIIYND